MRCNPIIRYAMALAAAVGLAAGTAHAQTTIRTNSTDPEHIRQLLVEVQAIQADPHARIIALADADAAAGRHVLARARPGASAKKEKAAFLGVVTSPVSAAMREQLKLQRGVGLLVESVQKDSPAEQAGIKQYDILDKLDDQWLINSQQLGVLVRMRKPGDEVTLSLLRQGQPQTVTATLIEKEVLVADDGNPWGTMPGVPAFEPPQFFPEGSLKFSGPMEFNIDDLMKLKNSEAVTMSMNDDQHTLTLTIRGGKKHLTATDKAGNIIFNGPIDTEAQRQALPPELKSKVEKLETKPNVIRMRIERSRKEGAAPEAPATQQGSDAIE